MGFKSCCCCARHEEWGHSAHVSVKDLLTVNRLEERYLSVGQRSTSGHKERRRKICRFCREKIRLLDRCEKLESAIGTEANRQDIEAGSEFETQDPESEEILPQGQDTNAAPDQLQVQPPLTELKDKSVQVPEPPRNSYENLQESSRSKIRNEVISQLQLMLKRYVSGSVDVLMADLLQSKKFTSALPSMKVLDPAPSPDQRILASLVTAYKQSKNKELNKLIRKQGSQLQSKLTIGQSHGSSRISASGKTSTSAKTRTEAAKTVGRVAVSGDERRRLLSIVAWDFSYTELQKHFGASKSTITAARVHALLFGKGGSARDGLTFKRQVVSQDVLDEFQEFINRDDISRPSSCRSVLVDGVETGVRYWQCSISEVAQQYVLKHPNGVKRTYIYSHLPANFRTDSMLAGLCNICDEYGHDNFDDFVQLVGEISRDTDPTFQKSTLQQEIRTFQKFLKTKFVKQVESHSSCREFCMDFALDSCKEDHTHKSEDFDKLFKVHDQLMKHVEKISTTERKEEIKASLTEIVTKLWEYVGHLLRTKHQGDYYRYITDSLAPGEVVVIMDYKMKLEMGMRLRENQREWYGKRGISLHGFYVVAQVSESERKAEVIDLWSEDTKQDAWFTQSALDVCFKWLEKEFGGFSVYLFSDNGPHYHNTGVISYLAEVNKAFDLNLVEYNYLRLERANPS